MSWKGARCLSDPPYRCGGCLCVGGWGCSSQGLAFHGCLATIIIPPPLPSKDLQVQQSTAPLEYTERSRLSDYMMKTNEVRGQG